MKKKKKEKDLVDVLNEICKEQDIDMVILDGSLLYQHPVKKEYIKSYKERKYNAN